jgi:hypothetical protein
LTRCRLTQPRQRRQPAPNREHGDVQADAVHPQGDHHDRSEDQCKCRHCNNGHEIAHKVGCPCSCRVNLDVSRCWAMYVHMHMPLQCLAGRSRMSLSLHRLFNPTKLWDASACRKLSMSVFGACCDYSIGLGRCIVTVVAGSQNLAPPYPPTLTPTPLAQASANPTLLSRCKCAPLEFPPAKEIPK